MRILLVNKYFYLKGGSEKHFFDLIKLLEDHGHEVITFSTHDERNLPSKYSKFFVPTPKFTTPKGLSESFFSMVVSRTLRSLIQLTSPDIIHIHNISRHLSASVIDVANHENIPLVQTLHDYQLVCPNYKLFNGKKELCTSCFGNKFSNAIRYSCVDNSKIKSAIAALELFMNKGLYRNKVSRFIAPSKFVRTMITQGGVDKDKVEVLPHFLFLDQYKMSNECEVPSLLSTHGIQSPYFIYSGRLVHEKGIQFLVDLWSSFTPDAQLVIAGEGPLLNDLIHTVKEKGMEKRIVFLGHLDHDDLMPVIAHARAMLVPSIWHEPFSYAVYEAMACGVPVIASTRGGMQELIIPDMTGILVEAEDTDAWSKAITHAYEEGEGMARMGLQARTLFTQFNTPERYYERVMGIYMKEAQKVTL